MEEEGGEPEDLGESIETLLGVVADEPIPEAAPDLVSRTLRRVRGLVVIRDLLAFATLESIWDGLTRGRAARGRQDDEHPGR